MKQFRITIQITVSIILMLGIAVLQLHAQESTADGEFCVRAFEDTDADSVRDLNEPPLQRGISANLMDANGIVVASALLDNSPQAARGLICFQFLPPGQYTIEVLSAEFSAVTTNTMTNVVQSGEVPYVMEYGARRTNSVAGVDNTGVQAEADLEQAVPRIALSLAGAAGAVFVMSLIGLLIYLAAYRPRLRRASQSPADDYFRRPATTGSVPRVTDTAEIRKR